MKPIDRRSWTSTNRRDRHGLSVLVVCVSTLGLSGCTSAIVRSQNPDTDTAASTSPKFVGQAARPWGLSPAAIESVALVTGLHDTGDDPPQTPQRQVLIDEMQRRDVKNPNQVLASPKTAMAVVRAFLPPGVQKGDRIDVEVRVPTRGKTTSLRGGWLMETRLREMAVLDQRIHEGHVRALAQGPILVDALLEGKTDAVLETRGHVMGGGVATQSRPLGLVLKSEHHSVVMSQLIASAINRRFDTFVNGIKQGAATPKRDNFIELIVHPRYRDNLLRYVRVVEQIPLRETGPQRLERLASLQDDLLLPDTSAQAALRLEAIGEEAEAVLTRGLESSNDEVRFYAAEALAYLDADEAANHLAASAIGESAFRWRALTALGAMNSVAAHDKLTELLHVASAETRYGAFQSLQDMNPRDPLIHGDLLQDEFYLHEIATDGEPMIHVARRRRPEVVVFGTNQRLKIPAVLFAGKQIMVAGKAGDELKITKYVAGQDDSVRACSTRLGDVIRTLAEMGASYPAVVDVLQQAKQQGAIQARLVFDAVPEAGRIYRRGQDRAEVAEPGSEE